MKRPRSITFISWLFIIVGSIGLVNALLKFFSSTEIINPFEIPIVGLVALLAIVSGIFMLRGFKWARWLLVFWLIFHVAISFYHSILEVIIHSLLFILIAYFLFRKETTEYFNLRKTEKNKS